MHCVLLASLLVAPSAGARDLLVAAGRPQSSDENDGSRERPWRTISYAAKQVRPGDTVWIGGGVYRECVLVETSGAGPDAMVAFRATPGERVIVKGSEPLAGWTRCADEPDRAIWETAWPFEGLYPGMIGVDDRPLVPLSVPAATEELRPPKAYCQYFIGFGRGREAMFPGSFWYDEPARKLRVWLKGDEDPGRHQVEAAVRACWDSRANHLLVEGITFRYAPLVVPIGGVCFVMTGPGGGMSTAEGCIVRRCDISLAAFEGMVVRGPSRVTTLVEDCWVHHNGNGAGSFEGHAEPESEAWLVVRRCRLTDNNLFNWNPSWHCGGKHFGTRVFFDECEFARAYNAPGCWFDIHQRDCIVNRCHAHQNGGYGLYYEIGETGAFLNNLAEGGPHYSAVQLAGSSRTLVANNVVTSGARGIGVGGEGRADGKIMRTACRNAVFNNLLLAGDLPAISVTLDSDLALGNASDYNLLWPLKPPAEGPPRLFEPVGPEAGAADLETWRAQRGLDLHSVVADPLVEVKNGRFARSLSSPSATGGRPLTLEDLRALFAVRPMPEVASEEGSASIRDHQPASEAFVRKVAELLTPPPDRPMPIGPLPHDDGSRSLPIENADFEGPVLPADGTGGPAPGWTALGETAPLIWHAADTGLWNWYMPSGSNILVLPPGDTEVSVSQVLPAELEPDRRYRLAVWAGMRIDEAALPWPAVELSLCAGERVLGSIDLPEPTIKPHYGVWVENVLVYYSGSEAEPHQPLRVLLRRLGPARARACFDDVRLEVSPLAP